MIACNDTDVDPERIEHFAKYQFDEASQVDYLATLTTLYEAKDVAGFRRTVSEPECPDHAINALTERAVIEERDSFIHALIATNRLTNAYADMNLALAAHEGNMGRMAVWISIGADVRHKEDRTLMSAILGNKPEAIQYLQQKGCCFTENMAQKIFKALEDHPVQNKADVQRTVMKLRTEAIQIAPPSPQL